MSRRARRTRINDPDRERSDKGLAVHPHVAQPGLERGVSRALAEGRSDHLDAAAMLQLQRSAGNASVAEFVSAPVVQRGGGKAAPPAPAPAPAKAPAPTPPPV